MIRATVTRVGALPSPTDDPRSARRMPTGCRVPSGVRRVAAGAALLLALAGSAAAQTFETIQYRWIEVSTAHFPEVMYLVWTAGGAGGSESMGASGAAFRVPHDTPVVTVVTVTLRKTTTLEAQCQFQVAFLVPQGCEAGAMNGPCAITSSGMLDGRCRVAVSSNP